MKLIANSKFRQFKTNSFNIKNENVYVGEFLMFVLPPNWRFSLSTTAPSTGSSSGSTSGWSAGIAASGASSPESRKKELFLCYIARKKI